MSFFRRAFPAVPALVALLGCGPSGPVAAPPPAAPAAGGIDLAGMDPAVPPGDDFFRHANGVWLKTAEIPADRSSWGTWAVLQELTAQRTADLITSAAAASPAPGSDERKIGDTYATFMDEAAIEAKGLAPVRPALDRVAAIADGAELARALGETLRADVDVLNATDFYTPNLFGLWVAQDLDDPSTYSPFLLQGGLGMPDRDYYLDPSPRMAEIRTKYRTHVAAMLSLAGVPDAGATAARIVELETKIASAHASREESENVLRGNNHWRRSDFAAKAPGLDWTLYFAAAGLAAPERLVVWQPAAVTGISALVRDVPLGTWKEYLALRTLERAAPFLPKAFVEERFAFYGTALTGQPRLSDRWKRAVAVTDAALGEAVGRLYAAKYFPPSEKARAAEMVRNEIAAFGVRIDRLDWMAPETKARAKAKLAALKVGVGYPDAWSDFSGLEVVRGDALGNAERAAIFHTRRQLAKLGKPVDRGEWVMTPQVVNAVNLPAMNALNFPAAMLQPPYFDPSRPVVMDYGAIGTIIGHEISHSFDDQGALFDADGRLRNWWTKDDFAHFTASAEALVRQYDAYRPFPDLAVNGRLTLSENIADVAGLAAAYDAYWIAYGGKEAPAWREVPGDRQFFVSFAQGWRAKLREAAARQQVVVDSHAPAEYRADTVRNVDAWYAAFGVTPGQKLYLAPKDRVKVW
ncbi:MAG TPA: M13 family metallopeptidase [Thermoanaerobaculia bacterium]|nr:M13 family metallopeptidase [Thermoanaerobaculia bacterium]HQR66514.1 M13 family metallopeptidase [Thermoanaerobaculia bacterium]